VLSESCGTEYVRNRAFCGGIHSSNRVEKKREDDERGVCLIKHRRPVFKPTLVWNAAL